ncbi:cupin domain-containing protein [Flocculibacter collagenilyticus]|uniref:cupin domain-containing protein n=1 Tax=Flocculibacter collagenilyticus TaxID=2744479 RepID=UPI0018F7C0EF|nr:cupin domain-containing protein [Flocculibacter collagenilyticus]
MYHLSFDSLTPQQFLSEYWQKKPLLIKSGFKDFDDPISPDELAGLAAEEFIESRIVKNEAKWDVEHGPFETFEQYGNTHWTLLVQAVDQWHEHAAQLLEPFRFIPNWRIDDLMVSFSTPKGGVGPHLDQYDVFIVQGEGKRHWKVGAQNHAMQQHTPHQDLLQVGSFEPVIDAILEPGDILYIPPGCPHEGYAIIPSMNYSIGFRAPNQEDMLSSFVDLIIDQEKGLTRYQDPELTVSESPGNIDNDVFKKVQALMMESMEDPTFFKQWFAKFITEPKYDFDIERPEPAYEADEVQQLLAQQDIAIKRTGGVRISYYLDNDEVVLAVQSFLFRCDKHQLPLIQALTDNELVTTQMINSSLNELENVELLTTLLNEGLWFFVE